MGRYSASHVNASLTFVVLHTHSLCIRLFLQRPLAPLLRPSRSQRQRIVTFDPSRLTLLVFDQRLEGRASIRDLVERLDVGTVRLAADLQEAIGRLRDERVDAIVLDDAPGSGALELLEILRRKTRGAVQETPVILIVTPDGPRIEAARDAGVNELIARPATSAVLRERLEEVVMRPRRFIRAAGYVGPCRRRRKPAGAKRVERRATDASATRPTAGTTTRC